MGRPSYHRFYLGTGGERRGTDDQARTPARPAQPRPGHGTVFLSPAEPSGWWASWQDGSRVEDFEGDYDGAVEWATTRRAERVLIFSATADDYVAWPDEELPGG